MHIPRCLRSAAVVAVVLIGAAVPPARSEDPPSFILKWGTRGTGPSQFEKPLGIAVNAAHEVFVSDHVLNRIQKFTSDGVYVTSWGSTGSGPGNFNAPTGVATDAAGNVYVADTGNLRIQKFTSDGTFLAAWGIPPGPGTFGNPYGIGIDGAGHVYVLDTFYYEVMKYTTGGAFEGEWGCFSIYSEAGCFNTPDGIGVGSDGTQYVCDFGRILKWSSTGSYQTEWGVFDIAQGVAVDGAGNVLVSRLDGNVAKYSSAGILLTQWGTSGTGDGQFARPIAIAVDGDFIYVTDWLAYRVQKFDPEGVTPALPTTWGRLKAMYR